VDNLSPLSPERHSSGSIITPTRIKSDLLASVVEEESGVDNSQVSYNMGMSSVAAKETEKEEEEQYYVEDSGVSSSGDDDDDSEESDYSLAGSYDEEVANQHEFENELEVEKKASESKEKGAKTQGQQSEKK
jgi:hypothetical protein